MKKLIRNLFILIMVFIIPVTYVDAADETFSQIDIDQYVSLTYQIDGVEQTYSMNLYSNNYNMSGVKLYRLEQDGSKIEVTDATKSWQRDYNGTSSGRTRKYRYAKTFDKY